jgi:hypothetical protein
MVSDAVSAVPALVPRGGYAVATLIAAIWAAVIAAMVAMEKEPPCNRLGSRGVRHHPVVISTARYFASR